MKQRLKVSQKVIVEAGDYLKKQFLKRHKVKIKEDNTELLGEDLNSEEILMSRISKYFPEDSFLTEETDTKINSDLVWVIDPICGSYSYLRGVDTWSLSIALVKDKEFIIGLVYQPLLENLFYSLKGDGAYMNQIPIKPSNIKTLDQSYISVEHAVFNSGKLDTLKLIKDIKRVRVGHGSGGELAYVAAGYLDGVIKTGQSITHYAGGRAVLEEAGGMFVDFEGKRPQIYYDREKKINYVACNNNLFNLIKQYI